MTGSPSAAPSASFNRKHWWLGVLSAPAAWLFVEGLGYVVSARQCAGPVAPGVARIRITQLVICAIGLIVAINGLRIALSYHRALAAAPVSDDAPIQGRWRFMAASGVMLSVLFIGGIVLIAISASSLNVCDRSP
jgi:hypothetical protein